MEKKIEEAIRYYENHKGCGDPKRIKNDAANIFADSYEEYCTLWDRLEGYDEPC